jgi:hypothetical protein
LGLLLHEKFDYERLKLDFKLKEADNRFLQEELENKDRMLAMLTVGLKEVCIHAGSICWRARHGCLDA